MPPIRAKKSEHKPLGLIKNGFAVERSSAFPLKDEDAAAEYLGTTPRHVRHLWQTRQLTGVKVGKKVRFRQSDLDAFIEAHTIERVR